MPYPDNYYEAPQGYRWVSAARKKDIQWKEIRRCIFNEAIRKYKENKKIFETGIIPEEYYCRITESGVSAYGHLLLKGYGSAFFVTNTITCVIISHLILLIWARQDAEKKQRTIIKDAFFVSVYDILTPCKVNLNTKEISDIVSAPYPTIYDSVVSTSESRKLKVSVQPL